MWEPWVIARKPIEGRVQDNLRKWKDGWMAEAVGGAAVRRCDPLQPDERSGRGRLQIIPSLKPQSFLRQLVRGVFAFGEGVVLDPFAGSGSTLAAAKFCWIAKASE